MKRLRIQKQIQGPVGRIFKGRNTTDRQEGLHEVMVLVDTDGSRDKAGVEHCHRVYILESDRGLFSGKPFSHTNYTQHCVRTIFWITPSVLPGVNLVYHINTH